MLGFNEGRAAGNKVRVVYRDVKQVCCAPALSTWWSTKLSLSLHCCSSHDIATYPSLRFGLIMYHLYVMNIQDD